MKGVEEYSQDDQRGEELSYGQSPPATEEISPVVSVGSPKVDSPATQQQTGDEPLFDQFDELEDFLADLAGELGVYENL